MAGNAKSCDKHSMTSSDLGSSFDNDVDISTSNDVKGKFGSDDVISVDGSACLTLDSLEEEDSLKKEQRLGETPAALMQSQTSSLSDSTDSFYLHSDKENNTKIESCKDKCELSDLAVHSAEKKATRSGKVRGSRSTSENDDSNPETDKDGSQTELKTRNHEKMTEAESPLPDRDGLGAGTASVTEREELREDTGSCELRESSEPPASPQPHEDSCHRVSPAESVECLRLRKSQSLTDESSSDMSPKKNSKRSGIPRRKFSEQSAITDHSSLRSTPQNSPARVRRSLTLNPAHLNHCPAPRSADSSPGNGSPASFPQTPVRVPKLRRSASQSETFSMSSASYGIPVPFSRDNLTSRLRFEKRHQDHDHSHLDLSEAYLTPSQRKDLIIRELRAHVRQLNRQLDDKERQMEHLRRSREEEIERIRAKLEREVEEARGLAETARKEVTSLHESHQESVRTVATLQQQLEDVKKDMLAKLAQAEEIFLEMYNKGRESAIFEREEELELQGKGGRSVDATEAELRNKLVRTQAELAKWQTIQRHESYHTMPVPGTEAETTLRFLKDSVFHFLTTDKKTSDEHLRAIVRILRFSEVQREKIAHAVIHKRNKSGW